MLIFYYNDPHSYLGHIKNIINIAENISNIYTPLILYDKISKKVLNILAHKKLKIIHIKNIEKIIKNLNTCENNIFITEFFPFGRYQNREKTIKIIRKFKKNGFKIYSLLPFPYFTHNKNIIHYLINDLKFYDKVIINSNPQDMKYFAKVIEFEKRINRDKYLNIFKTIKDKLIFTGYLLENTKTSKYIKLSQNYILVYLGGGSVLTEIIDTYLKILPQINANSIIITGPSVSNEKFNKWKSICKKYTKVKILKYVENLLPYIKNASVTIGTAGQTAYEILFFKKKSILIPYEGKKNKEHSDQLARALLLKDKINSSIIRIKDLSEKKLYEEIIKKLKEKNKVGKINNIGFDGIRNTIKALYNE